MYKRRMFCLIIYTPKNNGPWGSSRFFLPFFHWHPVSCPHLFRSGGEERGTRVCQNNLRVIKFKRYIQFFGTSLSSSMCLSMVVELLDTSRTIQIFTCVCVGVVCVGVCVWVVLVSWKWMDGTSTPDTQNTHTHTHLHRKVIRISFSHPLLFFFCFSLTLSHLFGIFQWFNRFSSKKKKQSRLNPKWWWRWLV